VGGFFRKYARESVLSKVSLGTFPVINIAPQNTTLVVVDRFVREVRQHFHRAIVMCFDDFNRNGGESITLQSGEDMFFKKSIILAIYADFPAARKCACTGSACPQCFRKQKEFADAIAANALVLRTPAKVGARKRALQNMARTQTTAAQKRATALGIPLKIVDTGWTIPPDEDGFTPFGPDPERDNIYQNMPQVMLHGLDEGLTSKLCIGTVHATILEAMNASPANNVTSVSLPLRNCTQVFIFVTFAWLSYLKWKYIRRFMCIHIICNGTYICFVCIINVSFINNHIFNIVHYERNKCALLNMLICLNVFRGLCDLILSGLSFFLETLCIVAFLDQK
jgi:hypothetical protein